MRVDFTGGDNVLRALTLLPDGSMIAAGAAAAGGAPLESYRIEPASQFGVARLDPSGYPDSFFGTDGKVMTSFSGSSPGKPRAQRRRSGAPDSSGALPDPGLS